jgi:hypothetical protein
MDAIVDFLIGLSVQFPVLVSVFAVLYSVGLIFKALRPFIKAVVEATLTKKDDMLLAKVESHKYFKYVEMFFDFLLRLKVK